MQLDGITPTVDGVQRACTIFYYIMNQHDYVILSTGRRRMRVMEVDGRYQFVCDPPDQDEEDIYYHQRHSKLIERNPDELWHTAGGLAAGQNIRNTLVLCANRV
jgi:hypothetical protein